MLQCPQILCMLLFHKTIDAKFIVRGLCNPELIFVDICFEHKLLNS